MHYADARSVANRANKIDWDTVSRIDAGGVGTPDVRIAELSCVMRYLAKNDAVLVVFFGQRPENKRYIEEMYLLTQEEVARYEDKLKPA
jgi:hypothetical protein